jgi:hypothetical protein
MATPIGGTTTQKDNSGGTDTPDVPPFSFGCQYSLLALPAKQTLDLPKKKAANCMSLAAFKLAFGGGV